MLRGTAVAHGSCDAAGCAEWPHRHVARCAAARRRAARIRCAPAHALSRRADCAGQARAAYASCASTACHVRCVERTECAAILRLLSEEGFLVAGADGKYG